MRILGFGRKLREVRKAKGIGIKLLAKAVDVDYSYISKIEREKVLPSDTLIHKIASYLETDPDPLLIAAGKLPADIQKIFYAYPQEAPALLRESFGEYSGIKPRQKVEVAKT